MSAALPFSPAADRNKAPILDVLQSLLPVPATVLEIASGTGQHAAHCATVQPAWTWQPTDVDADALAPIAARCAGLANVRPPLRLDVLEGPWPAALGRFDAVYCANMLHISAWPTCAALMRGALQHLVAGGVLVLYGPYAVDGEPLGPGNRAFDADLRARNPAWGLRALSAVTAAAETAGLALERRWRMPADNLMLAFRKPMEIEGVG
jgi:SAM-dependent methyltransferase